MQKHPQTTRDEHVVERIHDDGSSLALASEGSIRGPEPRKRARVDTPHCWLPFPAIELLATYLTTGPCRAAIRERAIAYATVCKAFAPSFLAAGLCRFRGLPPTDSFGHATCRDLGLDIRAERCRLLQDGGGLFSRHGIAGKSFGFLFFGDGKMGRLLRDAEADEALEKVAWPCPCVTVRYVISDSGMGRIIYPVSYTTDGRHFTLRDILTRVVGYYGETFTTEEAIHIVRSAMKTLVERNPDVGHSPEQVAEFIDFGFCHGQSSSWGIYRSLYNGTLPRVAGVSSFVFGNRLYETTDENGDVVVGIPCLENG